jgi:hypothetical protein
MYGYCIVVTKKFINNFCLEYTITKRKLLSLSSFHFKPFGFKELRKANSLEADVVDFFLLITLRKCSKMKKIGPMGLKFHNHLFCLEKKDRTDTARAIS